MLLSHKSFIFYVRTFAYERKTCISFSSGTVTNTLTYRQLYIVKGKKKKQWHIPISLSSLLKTHVYFCIYFYM